LPRRHRKSAAAGQIVFAVFFQLTVGVAVASIVAAADNGALISAL
jgi:hypothetical protein